MFFAENTAYTASTFTNFSLSFVTTTFTDTVYAATVTTGSLAGTVTETATTDTAYAACATNNYADSIIQADLSAKRIFFVDIGPDGTPDTERPGVGPDFCCQYAIQQSRGSWAYDPRVGCVLFDDSDPACTPTKTNFTAIYGDAPKGSGLIIGNGACAEWTAARFSPFPGDD